MSIRGAIAAVMAGALSLSSAAAVSYTDLLARPTGKADAHIVYGGDKMQFVELWQPKTKGPHPVVLLMHGGCWLADLPGLELMNPMAEALRDKGFAVWNIEYRRIGAQGGGYPATFLDAAHAADAMRDHAKQYGLDLNHVVAVGHSAGGQLVLWLAARQHLPKGSAIAVGDPLKLAGVVSLAGIVDLKGYREDGQPCGGAPTIDAITGAAVHRAGDVYADTSPIRLLPLGVKAAIISGAKDEIVPETWRLGYVAAAQAAGDHPQSLGFADAGHFELIDPQSTAWPGILEAITEMSR